MKKYSDQPTFCHHFSGLPLFDWRPAVNRPATHAGLLLSRRYRIHPAIADLVASLAGLGSGVER
jgi:hypothetical protein